MRFANLIVIVLITSMPMNAPLAGEADDAAKYIPASELESRGAKRIADSEEVRKLMSEKKISLGYSNGRTTWTNEPDGKLSGRGRSYSTNAKGFSIVGTWRIGDNANYCVDIDSVSFNTKWCRVLYRLGNDLYLIGAGAAKKGEGQAQLIAFE